MKGTFLGYQQGTDKKGKEYRVLFYSYSNARVHGLACDKAFVYKDSGIGDGFPWDDISHGEALDLDFDSRGYLVGLDLLMPVK